MLNDFVAELYFNDNFSPLAPPRLTGHVRVSPRKSPAAEAKAVQKNRRIRRTDP